MDLFPKNKIYGREQDTSVLRTVRDRKHDYKNLFKQSHIHLLGDWTTFIVVFNCVLWASHVLACGVEMATEFSESIVSAWQEDV